jgi:TM2 domain-containing membrane protein YozV
MTSGIDFFNKDVQLKKIILGNKRIVAYCSNPLIVGLIIIITIFLIIIYIADCKIGVMKTKKIVNIFLFSYLVAISILFFNNTILCHQLMKKNENVIHDEFEQLMHENSLKMSTNAYNPAIESPPITVEFKQQ